MIISQSNSHANTKIPSPLAGEGILSVANFLVLSYCIIMKKIIAYLNQSMQDSLSNSAHQLVAVGAIAFFGFPLFYWVWTVWFPQPYETLPLRLIGSLLGFGLMLTPWWPDRLRVYLPGYWFLTITYTLSFFFAYSFLMNQAQGIAAMALLCAVFILVLLVDLLSLFAVILIGWSIALIAYYLFSPEIYFGEEHIEIALVLLFVIIAGSTVNYKTAMLQEERIEGMAAVAGMIAHELRTPLLGIKSGALALDQHASRLMEGYQAALNAGLIKPELREKRLKQLTSVPNRIMSEVDYANTIIDMLLIKSKRKNILQNAVLEPCSMAECLQSTMERYPFKSDADKNLISYDGDFQFMGSPLLMQHILFNLLKNALYMIAKAHQGNIRIWTVSDEKHHYLYFKDTACGMSPKEINKLFRHFHSTTFMGTGLGLSFCKMVMQRFGGDIRCDAKEGEFTLFELVFPVNPSSTLRGSSKH